ncbi:MAG: hypothetical protein ISR59_10155 [Anaerolineales bacterium]|nr:hypothetical protein [Anaerolineales bacterium]
MPKLTITPPNYVVQSEELYDRPIDPQVARRLAAFAAPYKWKMLFASLLMLISTFSSVAGPYLVKVAIDEGISAGNPVALRNTVIFYFVLALIRWAFIYYRVNIMARVGQSVIYDLRKILFEHLQQLSLSPSRMWRSSSALRSLPKFISSSKYCSVVEPPEL